MQHVVGTADGHVDVVQDDREALCVSGGAFEILKSGCTLPPRKLYLSGTMPPSGKALLSMSNGTSLKPPPPPPRWPC